MHTNWSTSFTEDYDASLKHTHTHGGVGAHTHTGCVCVW